MRASLIFSLLLLCVPPAFAQDFVPREKPRRAGAEAPGPAVSLDATRAGRDVVHALVMGSGLLDMIWGPMVEDRLPELRNAVVDSPLYRNANREHRAALMAFVETMPDVLRREMDRELAEVANRSGPRLAAIMSAEELQGIADFFTSPASRPLFETLSQQFLAEEIKGAETEDYSPEDIRIVEEFVETPAGRAFTRHSERIITVITEEFQYSTARMAESIPALIARGMCDALEDECPSEIRGQDPI